VYESIEGLLVTTVILLIVVRRHQKQRSPQLDSGVWKMSCVVFVVIVVAAAGCVEARSMHGEIHRRGSPILLADIHVIAPILSVLDLLT